MWASPSASRESCRAGGLNYHDHRRRSGDSRTLAQPTLCTPGGRGPTGTLVMRRGERHDRWIEPLIDHNDVTTIMRLLGDIQQDVHAIRELLEDDDGEEEASEDDG